MLGTVFFFCCHRQLSPACRPHLSCPGSRAKFQLVLQHPSVTAHPPFRAERPAPNLNRYPVRIHLYPPETQQRRLRTNSQPLTPRKWDLLRTLLADIRKQSRQKCSHPRTTRKPSRSPQHPFFDPPALTSPPAIETNTRPVLYPLRLRPSTIPPR